ncbi:hypothetical protein [Cellulosimicrobium marinum]|uniref:hypothetical protein n=1 Tax=Cellulosimicrobium marinum TaxID=1638992 RepID=UPI001E600F95|nr:hypothetical protein [Cellulosimicrobium marinum]MCB7137075.1 hypothetical protein [Cellulosimicrobium marinum]
MSTTTPAGPPAGLAFYAHVRAYADEVRAHLADLRPDQVTELADGLEADLAEAVVDAPGALPRGPVRADADAVPDLDLAALFGPPAAYAHELRVAAGLGPRSADVPQARRGVRTRVADRARSSRARWAARLEPLRSTSQWAAVREFARALTPVWWVVRGWVAASVVLWVFGGYAFAELPPDLSARVLLLAAVVVSVQWGRGRWLPQAWMPRVVRWGSVGVAVITVPLVLTTVLRTSGALPYDQGYQHGFDAAVASGQPVSHDGSWAGDVGSEGVWVDGMQVSNLFVYDAAGNPVRDVQVFDDRGRPVRTVSVDGAYQPWSVPEVEGAWYFQPALASDGRERWNVYPLRAVAEEDADHATDDGRPVPVTGSSATTMPWPFLQAPTVIPATPGGAEGDPATEGPAADDPAADDATTADPGTDEHPATRAPGEQAPAGTVRPPAPTPSPVVEAGS